MTAYVKNFNTPNVGKGGLEVDNKGSTIQRSESEKKKKLNTTFINNNFHLGSERI
jgi:hypothetical protein